MERVVYVMEGVVCVTAPYKIDNHSTLIKSYIIDKWGA
jgi:hypothetical protein